MKLLVNGEIRDKNLIELDGGYFYGYGAFETILIKDKKAVLLTEHVQRLNQSLRFLGIQKQFKNEEVEAAIALLGCSDVALKINVSEQNVVYSTRPVTYSKIQYEKGAKLRLSKVLRNPTSLSVSIKSMNYMDNLIELKGAREAGYQDALFMNNRDEICETSIANLFIIKDNELYTPSLECGLLNGVIRQWLIDHYNIVEKRLSLDEVISSDGVFITNSLMGIMRVASIDESQLKSHPLIKEISSSYRQFIAERDE